MQDRLKQENATVSFSGPLLFALEFLVKKIPLLKSIGEQKETVAGVEINARFNRLSLLNLLFS